MKGKRLILFLALFGGVEEQCCAHQPRESFLVTLHAGCQYDLEPNVFIGSSKKLLVQPKESSAGKAPVKSFWERIRRVFQRNKD